MKDTIQKLPTNKMPKLNKNLNKAIKMVLEKLAIPLANMVIICFQKGKLPKCIKTTTIVILQKKKKTSF